VAAEVQALWKRNLPSMAYIDAGAKLRSSYLENPAGDGVGIALKNVVDDDLAGAIFLHRRRMHYGGAQVPTATLADFAVDVAYRTLGPALMLMRAAIAAARNRVDLLYSFPNPNSASVCRRAGMNLLGIQIGYARILDDRHPRVQRRLGLLRPLARPVLKFALRAAESARALILTPHLQCLPCAFDHPAIDAIWASRPAHLLLGERSAAMLRWRYGQAVSGDWNSCLAVNAQGQALGVLVWRLHNGTARIGDFFSISPSTHTASMLNAFCRLARDSGAHSVTLQFFGASEVTRQITQAGLRPLGKSLPVMIGSLPPDAPELADSERWYLTEFDNDAD
jgi:GNAT superfamily N-acetyltransferase